MEWCIWKTPSVQ